MENFITQELLGHIQQELKDLSLEKVYKYYKQPQLYDFLYYYVLKRINKRIKKIGKSILSNAGVPRGVQKFIRGQPGDLSKKDIDDMSARIGDKTGVATEFISGLVTGGLALKNQFGGTFARAGLGYVPVGTQTGTVMEGIGSVEGSALGESLGGRFLLGVGGEGLAEAGAITGLAEVAGGIVGVVGSEVILPAIAIGMIGKAIWDLFD